MSKNTNTAKLEHDLEAMRDLANKVGRSTVAVIDTIVQRGGFRGEELSTIGQLRDQSVQIIALCEAAQPGRRVNLLILYNGNVNVRIFMGREISPKDYI